MPKRRRSISGDLCSAHLVETLENRVLLSTTPFIATSTDVADIDGGPLTKAGGNLANLYIHYRAAESANTLHTFAETETAATNSSVGGDLEVDGSNVGVELVAVGDLATFEKSMTALGMTIESITPKDNAIAGDLPITLLSQVAQRTDVLHITPLEKPQVSTEGIANDQADGALQAIEARSNDDLTGQGVTVGVISDSVNRVGNGLADSVATGDLPSNVDVLEDGSVGDTDEGRAILEEVHDIAPGASLEFHTSGNSQQSMADAITALQNAGSTVIIDDIGFPAEPFFQPGVISAAVNNAVADGVTYVTAAGNNADAGFEQAATFVAAGDGSGDQLINFNAGGSVATRMTINVTEAGELTLEWDDPYDGTTGTPHADLDIYLYSANGQTVEDEGTDDNFETGVPLEQLEVNRGTYQVEILAKNTSTANLPHHFEFNGDFTLGSTEYSGLRTSVVGHSGLSNAISVGAVAFYDAPPYSSASTIPTEDFSSDGPVVESRDVNGNLLSTAVTIDKPDLSGIDGNNTSFFGTDSSHDTDTLPNFFGTSSAAGNVAGVAALLQQAAPGASESDILTAMKATAVPVNGQTAGSFDPAGGFGLIDTTAAVAQLRSQVNAPAATIIVTPDPTSLPISSVEIEFTQVVSGFDLSDLSLQFNGGMNLLTSSQTLTTTDNKNFVLGNLAPLTTANGTYTVTLTATGSGITGTDGAAIEVNAVATVLKESVVGTPAAPTKLTAVALSDTAILLTFSETSSNQSGFLLQRSTEPTFKGKVLSVHLATGARQYTASGLVGTTYYYFRLQASNANGSSNFTKAASAKTLSPGTQIVDNAGSTGVTIVGIWTPSATGSGFFGLNYLDDENSGKGNKSVKFRPNLPFAGEYEIYATWTKGSGHATNVPFDIFSETGVLLRTVRVNERTTGGSGFVALGKFRLHSSTAPLVRVRNTGTSGEVIADAVKFVALDPPRTGAVATPAVARAVTTQSVATNESDQNSGIQLLQDELD